MKKLSVSLLASVAMLGFGFMGSVAHAKGKDALSTQTVKYQCQGGKGVVVNYGVNGYGIVHTANLYAGGKNRTLYLDKANSDNVDRFFKGQGYTLATGYMDDRNLRSVRGVNITAPNNQIIYKGCNPR